MALVSISEAARLTGKSRRTIQRHLSHGIISKVGGENGRVNIDTTELLRVYGAFIGKPDTVTESATVSQCATDETVTLKAELAHLKQVIELQKEHIDSLKNAMLLLEDKTPRKGWRFWRK